MSSYLDVTDSIDKEENCGKCTGPSVSNICKDLVNTLLEQCQCKYPSCTHLYLCTGPSVSSICKELVNTLLEQCQC